MGQKSPSSLPKQHIGTFSHSNLKVSYVYVEVASQQGASRRTPVVGAARPSDLCPGPVVWTLVNHVTDCACALFRFL